MQFPLLVLARIQDLTLGGSAAQEAEGASDVLSATGEVVTRDVSISNSCSPAVGTSCCRLPS